MGKQKQFLFKINNHFSECLKYVYKEKLLKEVESLYKLFSNKKVIEIVFLTSFKEVMNPLDYNTLPKWIRGITLDDTIYMLRYTPIFYGDIKEFHSVLLHEITHVLIYRRVKQSCPLWLNEGLALILSKQYKNIDYKCFLNSDYDLSSYDHDYFYEKCCAKTIKCINKYGEEQFITKLIANMIDFNI